MKHRSLPLPGVYRGTVGKCVRCEGALPAEPASGLAAYFCRACWKRVEPEALYTGGVQASYDDGE